VYVPLNTASYALTRALSCRVAEELEQRVIKVELICQGYGYRKIIMFPNEWNVESVLSQARLFSN
jgi:hypothetical protein